MLIDSHCHLDRIDLSPYGGDFNQLLVAIRTAGVSHMLCVAIDMEQYPLMLQRVRGQAMVSTSVGVHPSERYSRTPSPEELAAMALADPQNVAIGETGLDYYRSEGDLEWQQERFRQHIRAARLCQRPLIIHSRDAREDTLRILREEGAEQVGGVMHCFTESWEMACKAMDLGFYISFSGIVTFANAKALREVAKQVPAERLLLETDAPYLAPVPHRGKPNEPRFLPLVAKCVAELRELPLDELAQLTSANFLRLFSPHSKAPASV